MSAAVRVRKRPPVAYVPIERNKVVVVPTDDVPHTDEPTTSPTNIEHLQQQAQEIASDPNSKSISPPPIVRPNAPQRLRSSTIDVPTSSRPYFPFPKRGATSVYEGTEPPESSRRNERRQKVSWVEDHILRPVVSHTAGRQQGSEGPGSPLSLKPERPRISDVSGDRISVASSIPQVEVIIPDEARGNVGQALASRDRIRPSEEDIPESILHHNDIVEHLDVIDQHISTVSHLSNAANSILIPPLSFYSRKPTITMPMRPIIPDQEKGDAGSMDELDLHVEDLLSRRNKIRRSLQGLWAFLKTPIGIVTAIYGFAVVFWGAAIVLFLGKLINLHNAYLQGFWVEISSQVVNALFTVQGVGFLPWRIMDTYHILWISHFDRLDQRLRKKAKLPPVGNRSDIPDPLIDSEHIPVLTEKQLEKLRHHQVRFMKSQTWYRPHATDTHRAFSIKYALAICLCVDGNSVFQIILCGCMWGLDRFNRPAWTTGSLIPLSFICGIGATVLIWKGGERSKKTEEVEARLREALEREKRVLKERTGSEKPAVVPPPSESPQPRDSLEKGLSRVEELQRGSTSRRSPLIQSIHISETMSIPEEPEPPEARSPARK
ncbi:hypothetical protein FS842_003722 [Serendipita sp. 407]|nr:hypothetical protein FS842_003722 [Serendipita sp. 407]